VFQNQQKKKFDYSVGKHKGFFLQLLKTLLNDIADPYCFETKQFLANIVLNYLNNINLKTIL
jgi:hypothetical protein